MAASSQVKPVDMLMIGTGEYTTGYVYGEASDSDKSAGVVALTMFDLRRRGKTYSGLDMTMDTFPADDETDPKAYEMALQRFKSGDAVTVFTPDDTHFDIALACVQRGLHVLVTKPVVKTLAEHRLLKEAAEKAGVLVMVEVHKRFDPIYLDAKDKIQELGDFSYMYSYMSQPKHQLDTFRAWAGKASDISYYLNSHHTDFHEWAVQGRSRPIRVTALASTGVATSQYKIDTEDTITLSVQWQNRGPNPSLGTGLYTSSWVAPKSDVHSQQRFFYMGQGGEVNVDQAHRGYTMASDSYGGGGFKSVNPLFMKYTPSKGKFVGQRGYGYMSFEAFVDAVAEIEGGRARVEDFDSSLATIGTTALTTAILEAGRRSLDAGGRGMEIVYGEEADKAWAMPATVGEGGKEGGMHPFPTDIKPVVF
ncbi:nad binding rossmann fold oxidoreductase [Nannochloropsis oceanica]